MKRVFIFLLCLVSRGVVAQDAPKYSIAGIEFTGLQRYTAVDVTRVSHLAVGQSVTEKDLASAAATMSSTGLFKNVRYSFTTTANQIVITFDIVEEKDWSAPVIYDNFIGIDDEELDAAVREVVPAYVRTAPVKSAVPDLITQALSGVLRRRGGGGSVVYTPRIKLGGGDPKHIFAIANPAPLLCALHVDGAVAVKETQLQQLARPAIGKPYSRQYMTELTSNTLLKTYRDRSYFGATVQPLVATLGNAGQCQGALLTVRVEEGPPYQMGQFSVEGAPELAASLVKKWKLKTGAPFIASYPAEFQQKVVAGLKHNLRPLVLMTLENHTAHVVDVIVGPKK